MHGRRTRIIVAAIAFIDIGVGHVHARVVLDRCHRCGQGVAVVRVAPAQLGSDDPVATVGRRDSHLLAKLVSLVRLALADAHHLWLVQAVELLAVGPLLRVQTFAQGEQFGQRLVRLGHAALDVANHSAQQRAQLLQLPPHPFELLGVSVAAHLDGRFLRDADVRLPQLDAPFLCRPSQLDDSGVVQFGIGGVRDVLFLNCGIDTVVSTLWYRR